MSLCNQHAVDIECMKVTKFRDSGFNRRGKLEMGESEQIIGMRTVYMREFGGYKGFHYLKSCSNTAGHSIELENYKQEVSISRGDEI